jgi:hypothetical protein
MVHDGDVTVVPDDGDRVPGCPADDATVSDVALPVNARALLQSSGFGGSHYSVSAGAEHLWHIDPDSTRAGETGISPHCPGMLAARTRRSAASLSGKSLVLRRGNEPVAHRLLAREFPRSAGCFSLLPGRLLGGLFVKPPPFHFAKYAFALHFLLQDSKGLIDIVVADEDLQIFTPMSSRSATA